MFISLLALHFISFVKTLHFGTTLSCQVITKAAPKGRGFCYNLEVQKSFQGFNVILFLFLGLSPIGIVLPGLVLCSGGSGNGINCEPYILNSYLEPIMMYFEFSFFLLFGFVWLFIAAIIWMSFVYSGVKYLFERNNKKL